ncbi:MAG: pyruvate kinase [Chloroflexota bacterium]
MRRTKIVATIGPASAPETVMRQMLRVGLDVARLNFSHGDHATHTDYLDRLRRLAVEEGTNLAVLQDLQGPRLRIGSLAGGEVELVAGQTFTLTSRQVVGTAEEAHVEACDLPRDVHAGDTILIDDGLLELAVQRTTPTDVVCQVIIGGPLRPHKGINVPGVTLTVPAITEKDEADLALGLRLGVDYVALSFVRSAEDVLALRALMGRLGGQAPIIAKIEKHEAVARFDDILAAADGVMVARGDLGVETSPEDVPVMQKMVIAKCNAVGKPVITATQMLNSMVVNPRPTRAEASDVANAIFDGTDAVMLSAESSVGRYPVGAVGMMARIAIKAESALPSAALQSRLAGMTTNNVTDSIGRATVEMASALGARAIISMTDSGYTARMVARHRSPVPIMAMTPDEQTRRRLALTWGVRAALVPHYRTVDEMLALAERAAVESGVAARGDVVLITAGLPIGVGGRTNLLKVQTVGENL